MHEKVISIRGGLPVQKSSPRSSTSASWSSRSTSISQRIMWDAFALTDCSTGRIPACGGDVVVLDQDGVRQAETVVESAAMQHGLFFHDPQPRRGLAGAGHAGGRRDAMPDQASARSQGVGAASVPIVNARPMQDLPTAPDSDHHLPKSKQSGGKKRTGSALATTATSSDPFGAIPGGQLFTQKRIANTKSAKEWINLDENKAGWSPSMRRRRRRSG